MSLAAAATVISIRSRAALTWGVSAAPRHSYDPDSDPDHRPILDRPPDSPARPRYSGRMSARIWLPVLAAMLCFPPVDAAGADSLFDVTTYPSGGRAVAGELVELDGDGRVDFFVVALLGIPPNERREIRVYLQTDDGTFPTEPDHTVAVPRWSAVYDMADLVEDSPGTEIVLLRPDGVTLLTLANDSGRTWDLTVPGPTTSGLADDERGFEPFTLVYNDFGPEPWILIPQIGQLTALDAKGGVKFRLDVPRRANYLIMPETGMVALETDFQIFLDVPKLAAGDVDGDGRIDVVSSTRHEIRVFLQREDGGFDFEPDRTHALDLVTARDHIRGSGGVASAINDIDGDGLLDLVITHIQGGLRDAVTTIYLYMNRGGRWRLGSPDQTITSSASMGSNALYDVDRDGRRELLRIEFDFSLFEIIEMLVSRELDVSLSIHRYSGDGGFGEKPWLRRSISVPFSFQTFRLKGFVPTAGHDVNADGYLDFVSSGDGDQIEIRLGDARGPFARRGGRQKLSTAGNIHFADFDGDGLEDFLLFDPHNFDVPVQIGRNRGLLPGTPPRKPAP